MFKVKKSISILLALMLIFSTMFITACGSKDTDTPKADNEIDTITLNMGATSSVEHSRYKAAERFVEAVDKASDGKIKAVMQFNGVLGSETATTQATQEGTLEMVWVSDIGFSSVVPSTGFVNLPYLFPTYEDVDKYYFNGWMGDFVKEDLEAAGFKWLAWLENDYRWMSNSKHPINKPEDLNGLKMRTPETPIYVSYFKSLGTLPTAMSITEVATALQQKTIDGQDNGPILTYAYGFYEFQPYMTKTNHVYSGGAVLMNLDLWDSLSPATQEIIQQAATEAGVWQIQKNHEDVSNFETKMADGGVQILEVSPELDAFLKETAVKVWNDKDVTSDFNQEAMKRIFSEFAVE
ncbi:MAG TPA: TRAP transporter substrate-binding protein [Clostridia bacterium]|nr:TRAP transporter substrate-binding protein [Clostridia bacterium]